MRKNRIARKILAYTLSLAMIAGIAQVTGITPEAPTAQAAGGESWSGTGAQSDPWMIGTAAELQTLSNKVAAGQTYEGKHFMLAGDIDLSSISEWRPIGSTVQIKVSNGYSTEMRTCVFAGSFDGASHTIRKYTITAATNLPEYGLFGYLSGSVRNLTVTGTVKCPAKQNIGGIVGVNVGTVENCDFTGELIGDDNIGGIVGYNKDAGVMSPSGTIRNCVNNKTNNYTKTGTTYGGIAGLNEALIENCINDCAIDGGKYVGGIAGKNKGPIRNCLNTDNAIMKSNVRTGGIAGTSEYEIKNCTNNAGITDRQGTGIIGGIVGESKAAIGNCVNTGALTAEEKDGAQGSAGGIVGSFTGGQLGNSAVRKYVPKEDYFIKSCTNKGNIEAGGFSGGIAGYATTIEIENCVNDGTINSDTNRLLRDDVGGIIGKGEGDASIKDCTNTGGVYGNEYTGGIAGYLAGTVTGSVNKGEICGKSKTGGIVGSGMSVDTCTNEGHVGGKRDVGGIEGYVIGCIIQKCLNKGFVEIYSGNFNDHDDVGGIVGECSGSTAIIGCTNEGNVKGKKNIGGIAGHMTVRCSVWSCKNEGEIYKDDSSYVKYNVGGIVGDADSSDIQGSLNKGKVKGDAYVGGICGRSTATEVKKCFNSGVVIGEFAASAGTCAGGIVGKQDHKSIHECANVASVYGKGLYVGGIVGDLDGEHGKKDPSDNLVSHVTGRGDASVYYCYNRGRIDGKNYVGGLVGRVNFWQHIETSYNYNQNLIDAFDGSDIGKLVGGYTGEPDDFLGRYPYGNMTACVFTDNCLSPTGWDPLNIRVDTGFCKHYSYFTNKGM
ncbi:MAG: hypothetical protein IKQ97_04665, partial [Eubacterium sp.]|nr:hypothetical protein [Eubacterium sp.]